MASTPNDPDVLEKLKRGDVQTVADLFAAYGPYLRAVVRGHISSRMRAKFDSSDVVQSVWVQVIRMLRNGKWRIGTEDELRVLLATIARRRALNRVRQYVASAGQDEPINDAADQAAGENQPRASEVSRADDLWQQMLQHCPPEHHEILRLRRLGHTATEIAERTGLHKGSVRRVLRQLARTLADRGIVLDDPAADSPE